jgi:hypothetical protein
MRIDDGGRIERIEKLLLVVAEAVRYDLGHNVAWETLRKIREMMDEITDTTVQDKSDGR